MSYEGFPMAEPYNKIIVQVHMRKVWKKILVSAAGLLTGLFMVGQCPTVFDFYGNASDSPYWYSCTGNDFSFNLQSPDNWGAYEVNWGDGSALSTGANWNSPQILNHVYIATVDTFIVEITETSSGCIIQGVVVMEEGTNASIQVPVGGLTSTCAPKALDFINSSTNVSETTVFTWDFGDGSEPEVFSHTNLGQTISHLYEKYTVNCETEVRLTASNYCNIIQGGASEASFNPIRIWDVDEAGITASASILCYPDTTVTLTNSTERNCLFQGNIYQRYEHWNFGNYWGKGKDSIIDWKPWPPAFPKKIAFPGLGTYEVQLLDSNYCGIDTTTLSISIVAPPTANISVSSDTLCVGEPVTFTQKASGGADSYQWNFSDGSGWLPTGKGNITYVFNLPGTYNVCSAVGIKSSSAGCADTACVNVTVLPSPLAKITTNGLTGCDQLTVDYSEASTGAVSWDWDFDVAPNSFIGKTPGSIDYNSPGNYVTTLTVKNQMGCIDTDQAIVKVYKSPQADFLADNVCVGEESQFTDLSNIFAGDNIVSWTWNFGDGNSSNLQSPKHTYASQANYNVSLNIATANCSASISKPVKVEGAPIPDFSVSVMSGCSPLQVDFSNLSSNANNYSWTFGDLSGSNLENPSHTFYNYTQQDTTYTVELTAKTSFGCGASKTALITVLPGAQAAFHHSANVPGCAPVDVLFTNESVGATAYLWDLGDGITSTEVNPVLLYENNTGALLSYDIQLIAFSDQGCNDTVQHPISIYPTLDIDLALSDSIGCSPFSATMPFIPGVLHFKWDFGNGQNSVLPNPNTTYYNNGTSPQTFNITLEGTSPFGCIDTAKCSVIVDPQPEANFGTDVLNGCSPLNVTIENTSIQAVKYRWEYGDGTVDTTSQNLHSHTFINTTSSVKVFDIWLYAYSANDCSDSEHLQIEVYPEVQATINPPINGCTPLKATFSQLNQNGNTFLWDLGNGTQSASPTPSTNYVNTGTQDSTFQISLEVKSSYGCVANASSEIIVYNKPVALFDMDFTSGCDPAPIQISNLSLYAATYDWNYGDGLYSNNANPLHQHTFDGNSTTPLSFPVALRASTDKGCSADYVQIFTLYPAVSANFTGEENGCSPLEITFINQSAGATQGNQWDFGDGQFSSAKNIVHVFNNNDTVDVVYNVSLRSENIYGCEHVLSKAITVHPSPQALANLRETQGCYPVEAVLENNSIGANSYQWVYGTGETSDRNDAVHSYTYYNFGTKPTTYHISLNATSSHGCTSTDKLDITVQPQLLVAFKEVPPACSPLDVNFINQSQGAISYVWDFGDGTNETASNPQHSFVNTGTTDITYTVTLTANSYAGCSVSYSQDIVILASPVAEFTATPILQYYPETTVSLENRSQSGQVEYLWEMGDGQSYDLAAPPDHTYGKWGIYNISLTLDNGACRDKVIQQVEIIAPEPVASFDMKKSGCRPLTVNFKSNSSYATSWLWDFGDGGQSSIENPTYTYYQPGTYNVSLRITGESAGQHDIYIIENAIEIYPYAIAAFALLPDEVMIPNEAVQTLNLSDFATSYFWDFGDGETSEEENPKHYYQKEGYYDVSLVARNEFGCPDTFRIENAVYARQEGILRFPNAFTPHAGNNSSGNYSFTDFENDVFFPLHAGVTAYKLQIYNKWGELIFETDDVNTGWNGFHAGELCKQDVYAWKARARFSDGREIIQSGDVTLLIK